MKLTIDRKEAIETILEWDEDGIFDQVSLHDMTNDELCNVLNKFQEDFENDDRYEIK